MRATQRNTMKGIFLATVCLAVPVASAGEKLPEPIVCEGSWRAHCQGVATDGTNIYWSFSVAVVKTDRTGKVLAKNEIPKGHMGDLCFHGGKVYIGMNMKSAPDKTRVGDEVWEYDASTMERLAVHPTPQTIWCNNGIEWYGGSFWIVGNVSKDSVYNYVWEYTPDFRFKCCHPIASGWTNLGVQTICATDRDMVFGCYGGKNGKGEDVPSTVFAVELAKLVEPFRSNEYPPILPVKSRVAANAGEGIMWLDGRLWYGKGVRLKSDSGETLYTEKLIPQPVVNEEGKR